jgi:hypothetical protein
VDSEPELLGDEPVRLPRAGREPGAREHEVLDAEPRELWHVPWRIVLPVVLVAGLVVGGGNLAWHADQRDRHQESVALSACQRQLHVATIFSDLQLGQVAIGVRAQTAQAALMSLPARRVLPQVVSADRACRSVSVRPWHFSLRSRRDAMAAYSSALAAKLRAVAADGRDYYRDDPSLRRLRRAADIGIIGGRY